MTSGENHPNEPTRQIIVSYFNSKLPGKLVGPILDCPGGYILQGARPQLTLTGEKTLHPFAKISYDGAAGTWTVYWRRASTKWNALGHFLDLNSSLEFVKTNPNGCFFG